MTVWVCATCANHYPESEAPPRRCLICDDERQWVPAEGQRWSSLPELARAGHRCQLRELEPGLHGLGVTPSLGIGQRGLLLRLGGGNVLFDVPGFLDRGATDFVRRRGGLVAVTASHPHFYGAMVEWAHAFDAPLLVPEVDLAWVTRPDPAVRPWRGRQELAPGVTLVQCGGHFEGSSVLHWAAGAGGRGALFTGDTMLVTPGRDRVTFIRSAPNRLPLPRSLVEGILASLAGLAYDRIYGGWWEAVIAEGAAEVVERSSRRYLEWLSGAALEGPDRPGASPPPAASAAPRAAPPAPPAGPG